MSVLYKPRLIIILKCLVYGKISIGGVKVSFLNAITLRSFTKPHEVQDADLSNSCVPVLPTCDSFFYLWYLFISHLVFTCTVTKINNHCNNKVRITCADGIAHPRRSAADDMKMLYGDIWEKYTSWQKQKTNEPGLLHFHIKMLLTRIFTPGFGLTPAK